MAHAMILYGHRWHLRIQQRYQSNMSLSLFFRVLDTLLLPHCQRQWRLLLSVFLSIQSDINYPEQNEISWIYLFSPGAGDMMMYRLRCGVNVKWYVNYSFLNANWMQTYSELNSPDTHDKNEDIIKYFSSGCAITCRCCNTAGIFYWHIGKPADVRSYIPESGTLQTIIRVKHRSP